MVLLGRMPTPFSSPLPKKTIMTRNQAIASSVVGLWAVVLVFAQPSTAPAATPEGSPTSLRGEKTAVEALVKDGRLEERYLAKDGHDWIEVATAGGSSTMGPVSIIAADGTPLPGKVQKLSAVDGTLVEEFALDAHRVVRKLTITDDGSWVHVVTRFVPSGVAALKQAADHLKFSRRSDWSFSPSVGGFDPDAQYKAPLILVQNDRLAFGIVPDLAALDQKTLMRCNHALDLDVPGGPMLAVGFMPAKRVRHSVFALDAGRTWTTDAPLENSYYLLVTATALPTQAYRQAVRLHWERFGRSEQAIAAAEQVGTDPRYRSLALWDDWRKMVWEQESPREWLSVLLPDGSIGGGVRTRRWGPGPSIYLSAWFNSLRTSYGMALWARRTGNERLLELARQTVELALKSPGRDGAFKCIAVPTKDGKSAVWAAGDGSGGSTKDGFLGYDMCWTGYWLLRWRASQLPGSDGILPRCRRLAQFMIARQSRDGMLPTRFVENGAANEELSRTVKAETGSVVLFLLELYNQDRNPQYLEAAKKGLDFLDKNVIPQRQWYDFETFWSCSPRKIEFDKRTEQWPANDLGLGQTVAAYLAAYRATGEAALPRHGAVGARLPALVPTMLDQSRLERPHGSCHAAWRVHHPELRRRMVRCAPKPVRKHLVGLLSGHRERRVPGARRRCAEGTVPHFAVRELGPRRLRQQGGRQQLSLGLRQRHGGHRDRRRIFGRCGC